MTYTCKHCAYVWRPRSEKKPRACPNCKSYRWEMPKRKPKKEAE